MAETSAPSQAEMAWQMLLNGWGYNWYRHDNRMRADDLLIRNRACESLARATASLRGTEAQHRARYLPPPSREAPYPDPSRMAELRAIRAVRETVEAAEVQLRGAAVPTDDKIWQRHRDNAELLAQLVEADTALLHAAREVETRAAQPDFAILQDSVARLRSVMHARRGLLDFAPPTNPGMGTRFDV